MEEKKVRYIKVYVHYELLILKFILYASCIDESFDVFFDKNNMVIFATTTIVNMNVKWKTFHSEAVSLISFLASSIVRSPNI